MQAIQVLIVEDESDLRNMLEYALAEEGYTLTSVGNGSAAWQSMIAAKPHLVLLDWMLPDISGVELLRRMRKTEALRDVPVIMLTAKAEEQDKVVGLDSGADDYLVKPFSLKELAARIRSRLRHVVKDTTPILSIEGVELDEQSHRVNIGNDIVKIGPTEFRLLAHFMRHPERVYSRDQLLDRVWSSDAVLDERTVDVHIRRLRKILEDYNKAHLVQTVHGVGYRFSVN